MVGSYLQAPMELFSESCEVKQWIQGKKIHIYATVWLDSFVSGHPDAAIQDWAKIFGWSQLEFSWEKSHDQYCNTRFLSVKSFNEF